MSTKKISDNDKRICDEWILTRNATRSYMKVHPNASYETAKSDAGGILRKPECKKYIDARLKEIEEQYRIDLDKCIGGLARIATSNMMNYLGDDYESIDLSQIDYEQAAAIQEVTIDERYDDDGNRNVKIKIKLYDKRGALVDLGRHFGGFKNTTQHEGSLTLEQLLTQVNENDEG